MQREKLYNLYRIQLFYMCHVCSKWTKLCRTNFCCPEKIIFSTHEKVLSSYFIQNKLFCVNYRAFHAVSFYAKNSVSIFLQKI